MPIQLVPQKGGGRRKQTLQFCLFSLIVAFLVFRQLSVSAKSIKSNIVDDVPLDAAEGFDSPAFSATLGNIITPALSATIGSNAPPPFTSGNRTRSGEKLTSGRDRYLQHVEEYFQAVSNDVAEEFKWFREYLIWHYEMREKFPHSQILENPEGPKIWIVRHDQATQGGGLVDRMQGLVETIKGAHRDSSLVLLKWYNGRLPLEGFVVPHLMNFTLPDHPTTETPTRLNEHYRNNPRIRLLDFGHIGTGFFARHYGFVWHALFQPSVDVQMAIDEAKLTLGLVHGAFDAVHCRFGHPAAHGKNGKYSADDFKRDQENQLDLENNNHLLEMAKHAVACVDIIAQSHNYTHPRRPKVYFYADSSDLVNRVLLDAQSKEEWSDLRSKVEVVARNNASVAHILNPNENMPSDAFLSTFVDLYIASEARCVSMGVGRFSHMATAISGTRCFVRHQVPPMELRKKWGMHGMEEVPMCPAVASLSSF